MSSEADASPASRDEIALWRAIRATLAHIADAETHYYVCNLGCEPEGPQVDTSGHVRAELARAFAANATNASP